MSCKSAIYTVNNGVTAVADGGEIPLGSTVRRFGKNIMQNGNGILLYGEGYYHVIVNVTVAPTAAGTVEIGLSSDGEPLTGAVASEAFGTANNPCNLSINAILRLLCCDDSKTLTLMLNGVNATFTNVTVSVEKM